MGGRNRRQETIRWQEENEPSVELSARFARKVDALRAEINNNNEAYKALKVLERELMAQRRQSAWLLKVMRQRDKREPIRMAEEEERKRNQMRAALIFAQESFHGSGDFDIDAAMEHGLAWRPDEVITESGLD